MVFKVTTEQKRKSNVTSNKERPFYRRVAIHGKPKAGKTTAALGLAENMQTHMKRFAMTKAQLEKEKWVKADVLWLSADANATAGARARKIEVPEINLQGLIAEAPVGEVLEILEECYEDIATHVAKAKPQLIVVDTASAVDKPLLRYWENNAPRTKTGSRDSFAIWRSMIADHERLHTVVSGMSCDVVILMHSKPRSESESADKKARAQAIAGQMADIRFDFMYEDCANIYRRHNDLILVADMEKKGGESSYALYKDEHAGFEAGCRFGDLVPSKIECSLWECYQKYIEVK